jgi:exosortase family protein XrtM
MDNGAISINEEKKPEGNKKNIKPLIIFFGVFSILIAAYYLSVTVIDKSIFDFYIHSAANISAFLLNILGEDAEALGKVISTPRFSMALSFGCEGSEPIVLFLSALIAFPIGFKYKIPGIIIGGLFLYFLNQIRIIGLYYIGIHHNDLFETFHVEIFPIFFIVLAIIFWGIWIKWALKRSGVSLKK